MFLNSPLIEVHSQQSWHILCDFDGTISLKDTTDGLLQQFAQSGWQQIEEQWEQGLIGSQQCMQQQIALLDMSVPDFYGHLDQIKIDPHFIDLVKLAQQYQTPLTIVSDGLDQVIHYVLKKHHITGIPVIANRLSQIGDRQWRLDFPHSNIRCVSKSGTCKCAVAEKTQQSVVLIGDGRSDYCLSESANYVFAKGSLVQHCQNNNIAHVAFNQFDDIQIALAQLLSGQNESQWNPMVFA